MVGGVAKDTDKLWDEEKMLDIYIYDYLRKNQFKDCVILFNNRTRDAKERIDIDTPEGFLKEWWSNFWNLYEMSGTRPPEEYIDAEKMLHAYLFDYLKKRGFGIVADRLDRHTNCCQQKIEVDTVNGFLKDWWSTFWEVYSARRQRNHVRSWIGDELEKFYPPEKKYHRFSQPLYAIDIAMAPGHPRIAISQQLMQEEIFEIMSMPMPLNIQGVYSEPAPSVTEAQVQNEMNFHNHQQQQIEPFSSYSQFQGGNSGHYINYNDPFNNLNDAQMMNSIQMTQIAEEEMRRKQDFELMKLHAQQQSEPFTSCSQIQGGNSGHYINYNNPINNLDDVQMT